MMNASSLTLAMGALWSSCLVGRENRLGGGGGLGRGKGRGGGICFGLRRGRIYEVNRIGIIRDDIHFGKTYSRRTNSLGVVLNR